MGKLYLYLTLIGWPRQVCLVAYRVLEFVTYSEMTSGITQSDSTADVCTLPGLITLIRWPSQVCFMAHRVVEFATYSEMRRAIDKLDNTELNGRRVRLIEDKSASKRRNR